MENNGVEDSGMTETTPGAADLDEIRRAFLRYLPKRIVAFEKRILRYRFEGWEPSGMVVLHGDLQRLADASGRYGLVETRGHLLTLAQRIREHIAHRGAPDPQQAARLIALLSSVTRSVASRAESLQSLAPGEMPQPVNVHDAFAAAPHADADATASLIAPSGETPAAAPVAPDPVVELASPAEPAAILTAAPVELVETPSIDEPVAPAQPAEAVSLVEPVAQDESAVAPALAAAIAVREPLESAEPDDPDTPAEAGVRRIYHLSDGNAFARELAQHLEAEGYALEAAESIEELSDLLMCLMPQVLLVDASHAPYLAAIGALRREAQQRTQPPRRIQLVVMAAQDNFESRRAAHRAGADLVLFPPFDVAGIAARLQVLHASAAEQPVRVLIVEDDRTDALYAQTVLTNAGMQVQVEHDPLRVLDALRSLHPDLILMDLHMPFVNGVEVTMVIREHPVFARLPIVFLSGESDPDSRLEALNAGGDDFLFKPIRPRHLVAAVRDRMRRMHPVVKEDAALGASSGASA